MATTESKGGVRGNRVIVSIPLKVKRQVTANKAKKVITENAVIYMKAPIAKRLKEKTNGVEILGDDTKTSGGQSLLYKVKNPKTGATVVHQRKGTHRGGKAIKIHYLGKGITLPSYKDKKPTTRAFKTVQISVPAGLRLIGDENSFAEWIKKDPDVMGFTTPAGKYISIRAEKTTK